MRPDWDSYFFEIMDLVAKRATCDRGRSGCVIVKDKQILVTGYVGSPPGFPHCDDIGHLMKTVVHEDGRKSDHCHRTIHCEQNAICQAAKKGISIEGATVYVKMTPCKTCAMLLICCGVKEIKCLMKYQLAEDSEKLFDKANIKITYINDEVLKYD